MVAEGMKVRREKGKKKGFDLVEATKFNSLFRRANVVAFVSVQVFSHTTHLLFGLFVLSHFHSSCANEHARIVLSCQLWL